MTAELKPWLIAIEGPSALARVRFVGELPVLWITKRC